MKGGKVINYGVNKRRYARNRSVFKCSMHAEIDLLTKLGTKAYGSKLFLYRFNNTSNPDARCNKNGKPCPMCQHALKNAGVARVTYINNDGTEIKLKNRDMIGLVGEPSHITNFFLERLGKNHHGMFTINEFIAV